MHRYNYIKYNYKNKILQFGGNFYTIDDKKCNMDNKDKFIYYLESCPKIQTINESTYYYATLKIQDVNFNCFVSIKSPHKFTLIFTDTNYNFHKKNITNITNNEIYDNGYMIINFDELDIISTRFNFPTMIEKNKLETIMEILDTIYFHFCHHKIQIHDIADFNCPVQNNVIVEYNAILYRIFYTDKPIENISIYSRFGYNYSSQCNKDDLIFLRNYEVSKFRDFLIGIKFSNRDSNDIRIDLIHKLKPYDKNNLHYFFKHSDDANINTIDNCYKNYVYLNLLERIKRGSFQHEFAKTLQNFCRCVSKLEKIYQE